MRFQNKAMYFNGPCEILFMYRHVHFRSFTHEIWLQKDFHNVKYGESCNFSQVGNLGLRFQNEAMYINGPYEILFMHRHYLGKVIQY